MSNPYFIVLLSHKLNVFFYFIANCISFLVVLNSQVQAVCMTHRRCPIFFNLPRSKIPANDVSFIETIYVNHQRSLVDETIYEKLQSKVDISPLSLFSYQNVNHETFSLNLRLVYGERKKKEIKTKNIYYI